MTASRRGRTLIEIAVVLAVMGVILGGGIRALMLMMRAEAAGVSSLAAANSLSRLARQFRRDVHAARFAELAAGDANRPPQLRLTLADGSTVEWLAEPGGFVRTQEGPEEKVPLKTDRRSVRRDTFRLQAGENSFVIDDREFVALVLRRRVSPALTARAGSAPPRVFRIEARRGRDLRFQHARP